MGLAAVLSACAAPGAEPNSVNLSWDANPEPDIAGYILRYGFTSGSYPNSVDVGDVTTHQVAGLVPGVSYHFVVAAYNTRGLGGAFSEEAVYTPPLRRVERLLITSEGTTNVPIEIRPEDLARATDGATPIMHFYPGATETTLIAPRNHAGMRFVHWRQGEWVATIFRTLQITLASNTWLTAVYEDAPLVASPLIAYWNFEEGTGTTTSDKSGNGNHARLRGGASWMKSPSAGGAIAFDGVDGYLEVPADDSLQFADRPFTLALWVRTSQTRAQTVAEKQRANPKGLFMLAVNRTESMQGGFSVLNGDGTWLDSRSRRVTDGAWHHLAVAYTGRSFYFYSDGTYDADFETEALYTPTEQPLNFGALRSAAGAWPFEGQMDEIRFYDRALSAVEVAVLVRNSVAGRETQPGAVAAQRDAGNEPSLRLHLKQLSTGELRLTIRRPDGSELLTSELGDAEILYSELLETPADTWTRLEPAGLGTVAQWIVPAKCSQRFFLLRRPVD